MTKPKYCLKQTRAMNGVKTGKYLTANLKLTATFEPDFMRCSNSPVPQLNPQRTWMTSNQLVAKDHYITAVRLHGGDWQLIRRVNDTETVVFEWKNTPRPLDEIHSDILAGCHISAHDLNRFARSPKGAMLLTSMH